MKPLKKIDSTGYLTIAFYAAFAALPFLVYSGHNIAAAFRSIFIIFPTNYLLYILPAVLYLCAKKSNLPRTDTTAFILPADALIITLIYTTLHINSGSVFFSLVALLILSFLCINSHNELLSAVILLPGLLLSKLGLPYIFATYIPVLCLLLIKFTAGRKTEKKESPFLLTAYLYIVILTLILLFSKKLSSSQIPVSHNFTNSTYMLNFAAGCVIVLFLAVLVIARTVPVIKNAGIAEKSAVVLSAVYPVILLAINIFRNVISSDMKSVFVACIMMLLSTNAQLGITYGSKTKPFVADKMKNTGFIIISAVIFCTFCFE